MPRRVKICTKNISLHVFLISRQVRQKVLILRNLLISQNLFYFQRLLALTQNKHLTFIKKEEHDTRSTNVKNICTYFKDSFRIKMSSKGLVEQVAWTILAEIVLSRTQCTNYCTMKARMLIFSWKN